MEEIIKQQEIIFKDIKNQNNLLLGFIGVFIGIIFSSNLFAKEYIISYLGIIFSFTLSLYGFYLSTNFLSSNLSRNKKIIHSLVWIVRYSISFLFMAILILFYIRLRGLN
jgi:hypothetical protein